MSEQQNIPGSIDHPTEEVFGSTYKIKAQLAQAQARIQELEGLVREIITEIRGYGYSMPKVLSNPLVKSIMEAKPCQE